MEKNWNTDIVLIYIVPRVVAVKHFEDQMEKANQNNTPDDVLKSQYQQLYKAGEAGLEIWFGKYRYLVVMHDNGSLQLQCYAKNIRPRRVCNNLVCMKNLEVQHTYAKKDTCCDSCKSNNVNFSVFVEDVKYGSECEKDVARKTIHHL